MRATGLLGLLGTGSGVVLVTVALLPLVVQAAASSAHRRVGRGDEPGRAWRTSVAEVGMVWGTVPGVRQGRRLRHRAMKAIFSGPCVRR